MNKVVKLSKNETAIISGGANLEQLKAMGKDIAIAAGFGAGIGFVAGHIFLGAITKELNDGVSKSGFNLAEGMAGSVAGSIILGGAVASIEAIGMAKKWFSGQLESNLENTTNF